MSPAASDDIRLFNNYLALPGLTLETPTFDYLSWLVHANLEWIPFENVSRLLYLRRDGRRGIDLTGNVWS